MKILRGCRDDEGEKGREIIGKIVSILKKEWKERRIDIVDIGKKDMIGKRGIVEKVEKLRVVIIDEVEGVDKKIEEIKSGE